MRVYLPSTLAALALVVSKGELGPAPLTGHAVTPALTEWYASGDNEELEYIAMIEAARVSLRMLAADRADGFPISARRVVLAAEVPDAEVWAGTDLEERSRVRLASPIPVDRIAAVHVDDPSAMPDIEAAMDALAAADGGDDDASFTVDGAEAHELMWFATQEVPDLLT
ncbi:DUF6912 family protein [Rhizohabitans arisaemae]|uniref:DUF6912 family protein n=1 Tax=Rhizohabitans arisaemae TaxID=2720610 RepID=UPI0024B1FCFE|nr:hypothetical protein [Rhizohabitans arisaemae]